MEKKNTGVKTRTISNQGVKLFDTMKINRQKTVTVTWAN
jgi:hypothetical protein